VRTSLDDFYAKLTDEQKAPVSKAIGPGPWLACSRQSDAAPAYHRRRHHAGFGGAHPAFHGLRTV